MSEIAKETRRQVLVTLGAAGMPVLTGCSEGTTRTDPANTDTDTDTAPSTETPIPTTEPALDVPAASRSDEPISPT